MEGIREESIGALFNLDIPSGSAAAADAPVIDESAKPKNLQFTGPDEDGEASTTRAQATNTKKKKKAKRN